MRPYRSDLRRGLTLVFALMLVLAVVAVPSARIARAAEAAGSAAVPTSTQTFSQRAQPRSGESATFRLPNGLTQKESPKLFLLDPRGKRSGSDWRATVGAYCLQPTKLFGKGADYRFASVSTEAGVSQEKANKISWIAQNGWDYATHNERDLGRAAGVSGLTSKEAITATQAAIWYYTSGWELVSSNQRTKKVAQYLIDSAQDTSINYGLTIRPAEKTGVSGEAIGPFTVETGAQTWELSLDSPASNVQLATDAAGNNVIGKRANQSNGTQFWVKVPVGTPAASASLTLTGIAAVSGGSAMESDPEHQSIVINKHTKPVQQTAVARAHWVNAPKPVEIQTSASAEDGTKTVNVDAGDSVVNDTVTYKGLEGGVQYKLVGSLHDASGNTVSRRDQAVSFYADRSGDGKITVRIPVSQELAGRDLIVFQKLYRVDNGQLIASHEDRNSKTQNFSVKHRPAIGTQATGIDGRSKTLSVHADAQYAKVKDVVSYTNLVPNQTYTLEASLKDARGNNVAGPFTSGFTPTRANGETSITMTLPVSAAGQQITVFERLHLGNANGPVVATHEELGDGNQTVTVKDKPWISTVATGLDGQKLVSLDSGTAKVIDFVSTHNLVPGATYYLRGELRDASNNRVVGDAVAGSFVARSANDQVRMELTIPAEAVGKKLVVFEVLHAGSSAAGPVVAEHTELTSEEQSVTVKGQPTMKTVATDFGDGDKVLDVDATSATVRDIVKLTDLEVGTQYYIKGQLVRKSDNSVISTVAQPFVADKATQIVQVQFTVPQGTAAGDLVVFERLYLGSSDRGTREVVSHTNPNDPEQTVTVKEVPRIGTTATGGNGERELSVDSGPAVIKDVVSYENLDKGKTYTLKGWVMEKNGGPVGDAVTKTFTAQAANGSVEMELSAPEGTQGKTLVVFEELYRGQSATGSPVATHKDFGSSSQTVTVKPRPEVRTSVEDPTDGDREITRKGGTVVDTVTYNHLVAGQKYTVTGELMRQSDGSATGITGSETFTAKQGENEVKVSYQVPANFAGATLVVFETIHLGDANGRVVAEHKQINDPAQTFRVEKPLGEASIGTKALNKDDRSTNVISYNGGTIVDTVTYENIEDGQYTLAGRLMVREADGSATETGITASKTFQVTSPNGSEELTFEVPKSLAGKTIVVFEKLHAGQNTNGKLIASHENINDGNQTITVERKPEAPVIGTKATPADGSNQVSRDGGQVVDVVSYQHLTVGKTYTITGEIFDITDGTDAPKSTGITASSESFEATSANGEQRVTFDVPGSFAGKTLVVFEELHEGDAQGRVVAEHKDATDSDQMVTVEKPAPWLRTEAHKEGSTDSVIGADGGQVIDTVTYGNLEKGKDYFVSGELMTADGKPTGITSSARILSASETGSVDVSYTVPAGYEGKKLVVFEYLHEGADISAPVVATHADLKDQKQTITVQERKRTPRIETSAKNSADNSQVIPAEGGTVVDTVTFTDLEPEQTYYLSGWLVNKLTNERTNVTASATFAPKSANGTQDVEFTVGPEFAGAILVVFEELRVGDANGPVVAEHKDIASAAQTVNVSSPKVPVQLGTKATNEAGDSNVISRDGGVVIDTVSYKHLDTTKTYTVSGTIMDKDSKTSTGVTASKTFQPEAADGTVQVRFEVPAGFAGKNLVVFEKLYEGSTASGDAVATHEDFSDANQAISVEVPLAPLVRTIAANQTDRNSKVIPRDGGVVVDTVSFENLVKGKQYTIAGELMNKLGGAPTGITASKTFVADSTSGEIEVEYTVPASLAGSTLVVFERLYEGPAAAGSPVAVHEDINDGAQTVSVDSPKRAPFLRTIAKDKATDTQIMSANGGTVVDTVRYANLEVGKDYTISGELMNAATGEGTGIYAQKTFRAEQKAGQVEVEFIVPAAFAGSTLVVFETLHAGTDVNGEVLAEHKDLDDQYQTIGVQEKVLIPWIKTLAKDSDGDKVISSDGGTLVDTVSYGNLKVGQKYTVTGVLVDKLTGEPTEVVSSKSFKPTSPVGEVEVEFSVPSSLAGHTLVVFEKLHAGDATDTVVATHEDINSQAQTVTVSFPPLAPSIGTIARDAADQDNVLSSTGGTVIDAVQYQNLKVGKTYTVSGELMNQADGSPTGLVASKTFTAEEANGVVEVSFDVPADFAGKILVAFEKLYEGSSAAGEVIAEHAVITDAAQTITVEEAPGTPTVMTNATSKLNGSKVVGPGGGVIVDKVFLTGLKTGQTYTVHGVVMNKVTGEATDIEAGKTFVAEAPEQTVVVDFEIPAEIGGMTAVLFQDLYEGDDITATPVATHHNINDRAQTVTISSARGVPEIGTVAVNKSDGKKVIPADGGVVVDTVTYSNLEPGETYTVTGTLMNQADGQSAGVSASATFTPESADGSIEIEFAVPGSLAGTTLVAFEQLHHGDASGAVIASHEDINDAAQTVTVNRPTLVPQLGTVAVDKDDKDQVISFEGGIVVDTVTYSNLEVGKTYTVSGELMNKATRAGTGIVSTATFTPEQPVGSVDVEFPVPASLAGSTLVAFEKLYVGDTATGTVIASHEDIEDAAQTVTVERTPSVPMIGTIATDKADGDQLISHTGGTVVDTVQYVNLTAGETYTVSGELMNALTHEATGITATKTFVAESSIGTVELEFPVTEDSAGLVLVAFESLFAGDNASGDAVAVHKDFEDQAQTVTVQSRPGVPLIGTIATDKLDQDHEITHTGGTVVDTVTYTNLTVGTTYTITGVLMNKLTGESTGVESSVTFVPETTHGTVALEFEVPGDLAGSTLVAFETLHEGDAEGKVITSHKDLNDAAQTVTVQAKPGTPLIGTVAADKGDGDKVISRDGGVVVDTVTYTNLTVGTTYTVTGVLMNKLTGESTGITASQQFTAEDTHGTVTLDFTVPDTLAGAILVAFEKLHEGDAEGKVIASHEDINDAAQTVSVESPRGIPSIGTILRDKADNDQMITLDGGVVVDTVTYTNLEPGETYTLTGVLMDKNTGKATDIVATKTFVADNADGTVEVEFTIPAAHVGSSLVAFEKLYRGEEATGSVVASHEDINDSAQTVKISGDRTKPQPPKPTDVNTAPPGGSSVEGDAGSTAAAIIVPLLLAALVGGGLFASTFMGGAVAAQGPSPHVKVPIPVDAPRQHVVLAVTGDNVIDLSLLGMVLLAAGGAIFMIRRRRQS